MGRRTWIAGLVLCVGLTDRQTAAAQPLIRVLLMNQAEVPPYTLHRAQNVAARVFHLSGIALVWVDSGTCEARCLTVRVVTQPVGPKSRDPHVLGVALDILRVCEHLAVGAKHFEPTSSRHRSVAGTDDTSAWAPGSWAPGSWAGDLLIHLDGDAKTAFGDTISITELADVVVKTWRAELLTPE